MRVLPVSRISRLTRSLRGHRPFAVVLIAAAALRVVTMLGYRPAFVSWYDSYAYLETAAHLRPGTGFHPAGYPLLLRLFLPFHDVAVVVAVQHVLGLATGALIYAVLRRRAAPGWVAVAAAVPVLFDASFLWLEHAVLSDELFLFLTVAGVVTAIWTPRPSARRCAVVGLLLAGAALTRTVAAPLVVVIAGYLLVRRVGWRPVVALLVAAVVPLGAYATWYARDNGRFALTGEDGVALWARTMTFADCRVIRPPRDLARLCPNGAWHEAAGEYVWDGDSALNRLPGSPEDHNAQARAFALRAIAAQPLDYLGDVAHDTALAFTWTPVPHPRRITPAFWFTGRDGTWSAPGDPLTQAARRSYDPHAGDRRAVAPFAGFLRAYQYPAYLRGPFLLAILLAGAVPWPLVRRAVRGRPWRTGTDGGTRVRRRGRAGSAVAAVEVGGTFERRSRWLMARGRSRSAGPGADAAGVSARRFVWRLGRADLAAAAVDMGGTSVQRSGRAGFAGAAGVGGAFGRALVPWCMAVVLLVLPVAVLDFGHRYVLPVIPLACLAVGLAWGPADRKMVRTGAIGVGTVAGVAVNALNVTGVRLVRAPQAVVRPRRGQAPAGSRA